MVAPRVDRGVLSWYIVVMQNLRVKLSSTALVALFSITFAAHAQTSESCNLNQEKFAELEAIQNNFELEPLARIRAELTIRKSLLKDVVDCANEEILVLKSEFGVVKTTHADVLTLKNQFSGWFSNVINYYAIQKAGIDDLGLQGSKDFAKSFSAWREGNFKPTAKIVSNFIVWAGNQDFIALAQSRINQVRRGIEILGLTLNEEMRNGLAGVEAEFQKTNTLNGKAREALRAYGPTDDSLITIRASLESLSAVYKKLFELVEKINKEIVR